VDINLRFLDIAYKERFMREGSWMMKFTCKIKSERKERSKKYTN
jgi:hypothetical protein